MRTDPDISVIILSFNEARHIARAIVSVQPFAKTVFVVDSGSDDDTLAVARAYGAQTVTHHFINQAQQFNWALKTLPIETEWVLRLDADEVIENDLAKAISLTLPSLPAHITGIEFPRKHVFMGRWIRHGGRYPVWMLRLFRTHCGHSEDRWMDEHIVLTQGNSIRLHGGFADINLNDLTQFTAKHNAYATREAIAIFGERYALFGSNKTIAGKLQGSACFRRWLKVHIYGRLPFGLGPLGYFLYRYFIKGGFLDGKEGLIYHFLQGFWYRLLVSAKVAQWDRELRPLRNRTNRLNRLEELTGFTLFSGQRFHTRPAGTASKARAPTP
ncbi:glycosyltransferase family 2 protein [Altericroceibacterium spongiae]|uniref:Glycosyltransferase family 2 protein n=1 Tax=Altericroceibacterium spongiae TaxID=2320269 RepID=A0A420EIV9_9SPHN|nr:glycosyltransferase family 2 protein [Altericroceibacterium spongiae]RKF20661.1 glycosyltransferase family 2 protein [Altericroceibacterium spongiae]